MENTEETTTVPKEISAAEIVTPLVESMPVPTGGQSEIPAVMEAAPATPEITPAPVTESAPHIPDNTPRDNSGQPFDPNLHLTNPDGSPRLTTSGNFMRKRGPRKGATGGADSPAFEPPPGAAVLPPPMQPAKSGPDQFDVAAEMILGTGYAVGASFLGNDFRPEYDPKTGIATVEGVAEHDSLKVPLAAVLREKGTTGLTPTQLLMFAIVGYVGKKAAKPTVKEKMTLLYLRVKSWFNKNQPSN